MSEKKESTETSGNSLQDFIMSDINRQLRIRMQNAHKAVDERDKYRKASQTIHATHQDR